MQGECEQAYPTCCLLILDKQHVLCCSLLLHLKKGYTRKLLYPVKITTEN